MANPRQYKIPDWFLNRQKDIVDGKYSQVWFIYLGKEKNLFLLNYKYFVIENYKMHIKSAI